MTAGPRKRKSSQESAKFALRVLLIVGWFVAVVGVAVFTYSEAYPRIGQRPHQVGSLTLSQCGFWLIVSGIGLVIVSVGSAQVLSCILKIIKQENEANAVHTALGTGDEENTVYETNETAPLIGPDRVQYGSSPVMHASPFSSKSRPATVITSSSSAAFSKQPIKAR
jgi:hypothetical protein